MHICKYTLTTCKAFPSGEGSTKLYLPMTSLLFEQQEGAKVPLLTGQISSKFGANGRTEGPKDQCPNPSVYSPAESWLTTNLVSPAHKPCLRTPLLTHINVENCFSLANRYTMISCSKKIITDIQLSLNACISFYHKLTDTRIISGSHL